MQDIHPSFRLKHLAIWISCIWELSGGLSNQFSPDTIRLLRNTPHAEGIVWIVGAFVLCMVVFQRFIDVSRLYFMYFYYEGGNALLPSFVQPYCIFVPTVSPISLIFPYLFFQLPLSPFIRFLVRFFKVLTLHNLTSLLFTGLPLGQAMGNQLRRVASNTMLPCRYSLTWIGAQLQQVMTRCVGVQTMQPVLCRARSTTTPSPTITDVTSSPFTRPSLWGRWTPTRTYTPFTQRKRGRPRLWICIPLAYTRETVMQWRTLCPKSPPPVALPTSYPPAGGQTRGHPQQWRRCGRICWHPWL